MLHFLPVFFANWQSRAGTTQRWEPNSFSCFETDTSLANEQQHIKQTSQKEWFHQTAPVKNQREHLYQLEWRKYEAFFQGSFEEDWRTSYASAKPALTHFPCSRVPLYSRYCKLHPHNVFIKVVPQQEIHGTILNKHSIKYDIF